MFSFISFIILFAHLLSCTKPLDDEALRAIRIGKQGIIQTTSENDLLVFLGNSASYFYHAISEERDSYLVPISGRYNIDRFSIPVIEKLNRFEQIYLSPIVNKAWRENRRIVIVDHSHTGQSVDSFNLLLNNFCPACHTAFLNLVTEAQHKVWIKNPKTIKLLGQVIVPNIAVELFNDDYVRLAPYHPHWKWDESSSSLLKNYGQNSGALEAIKSIRNL